MSRTNLIIAGVGLKEAKDAVEAIAAARQQR